MKNFIKNMVVCILSTAITYSAYDYGKVLWANATVNMVMTAIIGLITYISVYFGVEIGLEELS